MENESSESQSRQGTSTVWQIVGRLITAAVVLAITAFFTPGFQINNIWSLSFSNYIICYTIFCCRIHSILDGCYRRCNRLRSCRLFFTW